MLAEDNMFVSGIEMVRGQKTEIERSNIKALFIEGMINFLEIYAQSEIGEVEVNIPAIALYVNSPEFENVECYMVKNLDDVYQIIEMEILMGLPIWRFLKLSDYQMNLYEKNYEETLKERQKYLENNYPCKRCIFFEEFNTPFGYISNCHHRKDVFDHRRDKSIDWTKVTNCENCLTVNDNLDFLKEKGKLSLYREASSHQDSLKRRIDTRKIENLDKYKITLKDLKEDVVLLDYIKENETKDRTSLILDGFADAFNNKRSKKERLLEVQKALYLEGFLKFIDLYAKNEIGNNFGVDIQKVVLYLEDKELLFSTEKELFEELEELVLNGFEINDFIKNIF